LFARRRTARERQKREHQRVAAAKAGTGNRVRRLYGQTDPRKVVDE